MKNARFLSLVIGLSLFGMTQVFSQEAQANLLIHNLDNAEITSIVITASNKNFPDNKSCMVLEDVQQYDESVYGVFIPDYMASAGMFNVDVKVNGKWFKTKHSVMIDFSRGKIPTLLLSVEDNVAGIFDLPWLEAGLLGITTTKPVQKGVEKAAVTVIQNAAPKAAAAAARSVLPKVGLAAAASITGKAAALISGPVGWAVFGGLLLVEGKQVYDTFFKPGDLFVQVDYN
ncbi:MAG: hypothetical protein FWB77_04665 [Treponema sp.]|nr:hypothetical protein [Treponema sp.]